MAHRRRNHMRTTPTSWHVVGQAENGVQVIKGKHARRLRREQRRRTEAVNEAASTQLLAAAEEKRERRRQRNLEAR